MSSSVLRSQFYLEWSAEVEHWSSFVAMDGRMSTASVSDVSNPGTCGISAAHSIPGIQLPSVVDDSWQPSSVSFLSVSDIFELADICKNSLMWLKILLGVTVPNCHRDDWAYSLKLWGS